MKRTILALTTAIALSLGVDSVFHSAAAKSSSSSLNIQLSRATTSAKKEASGTSGNNGADLQVQKDRNVGIYATNGQNIALTNTSATAQQVINYAKNNYFYGTFSSTVFQNQISSIVNQGGYITNIAFTPQGGWVIVYSTSAQDVPGTYHFYYSNIPQEAFNELQFLCSQNYGSIDDIKFAPQGGFVILYSGDVEQYYISHDAPPALVNKFHAVYNAIPITEQALIDRIVFTPQGGIILLDNNDSMYFSSDIPPALINQLITIHKDASSSAGYIQSLAITPQDGVVASINSNFIPYYYNNIPQLLANEIQTLKPKVYGMYSDAIGIPIIAFTPSGEWVLIAYDGIIK